MLIAPQSLIPILVLLPLPEAPPVQTAEAIPAFQDDEEEVVELGWSGSVAAGASLTDSNTDIQRASVTADGVRRQEDNRWTLGFSWNYAEEDDVLTQRRTFGRTQYDHFLSERSYLLADASAQSDTQASLDLRTSVGTGYGFQVREDETWKIGLEAGVAYVNEDLETDPRNEYIAGRFAYDIFWQTTQTLQLEQFVKLYPSLEDADDFFGQLDTRAKLTLTEAMFAQAQWVLDYNNTPATGKERADNLFLIGIGWSF